MNNASKKNSALDLTDLILKHNPGASLEMIAAVISEWGDLYDDHRMGTQDATDMESAAPDVHPDPETPSLERVKRPQP